MVCEPDETDLDIQIPAVMLPQNAGATLQNMFLNGSSGRISGSCFIATQWEMTVSYQFQILLMFFRCPIPWQVVNPKLYRYIVSVQLYSPKRPVVDIAEVFLWLMAVGTILCASYWSAWSAKEAAIEQDKFLKVRCGVVSHLLWKLNCAYFSVFKLTAICIHYYS